MAIKIIATPIPPNTKDVGYPWRDFMKTEFEKMVESIKRIEFLHYQNIGGQW